MYKYSLISSNGIEVSASDSRQTLVDIAMKSKDKTIGNGWIRVNYE